MKMSNRQVRTIVIVDKERIGDFLAYTTHQCSKDSGHKWHEFIYLVEFVSHILVLSSRVCYILIAISFSFFSFKVARIGAESS